MSKWIDFHAVTLDPLLKRKTKVWLVTTKGEAHAMPLGFVKWYAPWRQYGFMPSENTVYEKRCLRDIADFCEQQTKEHRGSRSRA